MIFSVGRLISGVYFPFPYQILFIFPFSLIKLLYIVLSFSFWSIITFITILSNYLFHIAIFYFCGYKFVVYFIILLFSLLAYFQLCCFTTFSSSLLFIFLSFCNIIYISAVLLFSRFTIHFLFFFHNDIIGI